MSSRAQLVVTVTSSRGGSTVHFSTKGRYISFPSRGYRRVLKDQPIQSTASLAAFWTGIITSVQDSISINPTPDN